MTGLVLAVDQGTTGTTALVVDEEGAVRGRGYTEFAQHYPKPGWVEHDPEDIWRSSVEVAHAAVEDAGVSFGDVAALGITNQRETTLLWDRATGEPVGNAVVWQDRRTAALCSRLQEQGLEDLVRRKTGLLIDSYFAAPKIRWLLDADPDLRRRAEAGEIAFGTVDTWLVHRLTGGRVHATDVTNASRTLLMDLASTTWDDELCEALKVPRALLPEIKPSASVFGETDADVFDGTSLPVAGILGDQQAALFAQACFEPGQVKCTFGTGSFVLMNTGQEPFTGQERVLATVAVGIQDEPVEYALEGSIFVSGAAVQWLRDELGVIGHASETEEIAAGVESTGDVYFVPAMAGLGAPHWDSRARGAIVGLTRGTGVPELVRATLESIAYQTRDVVDAMKDEAGRSVDELRADGGAAENGWLMQFQADVLGVPVDVPENVETTSLGSAYLAGLVTGVWSDRDELQRRRRTARRFEPRMGEDEREAGVQRWRAAVERARGWAEEEA